MAQCEEFGEFGRVCRVIGGAGFSGGRGGLLVELGRGSEGILVNCGFFYGFL